MAINADIIRFRQGSPVQKVASDVSPSVTLSDLEHGDRYLVVPAGDSQPARVVDANLFASVVSGSSGAAGTSKDDPFDNLSDVQSALSENDDVAIESGSGFSAAFAEGITDSPDNVTLKPFGALGTYYVDCDQALADADWSLASGQSNTYVQSKPAPTERGARTARVFADGMGFNRVGSASNVESNPGSYYVDDSGDPYQIYVHPEGSTDPSTNNVTYSWTGALAGAYVSDFGSNSGDKNMRVEGMVTRRPLSNDGGVVVGVNSVIDRCLVVQGGKHHFLHGGGLIRDSIAFGNDPNRDPLTSEALTYFHAGAGGSEPAILENFMVVTPEPYTGALPGAGSVTHSGFSHTEVRGAVFDRNAGGVRGHRGTELKGVFSRETGPGSPSDATLEYSIVDRAGSAASGKYEIHDSVLVGGKINGRYGNEDGDYTKVDNTVILASGIIARSNNDNATVDIEINNSVVFMMDPTRKPFMNQGNINLKGDNNVFFYNGKDEAPGFSKGVSLSDLQSNTGAFGNSVFVNVEQFKNFFSGDWRKGDFRINLNADVTAADGTVYTGQLPDGTSLSAIGPNYVWDYNKRHRVYTGHGPTQWPTNPTTVEEAEEYVKAPNEWNWKGDPHDYTSELTIGELSDGKKDLFLMDGASSDDEPSVFGGTNTFTVNSGSPASGSTGNFSYRTVTGSDSFSTGESGAMGSPDRFWMAFPFRIQSGTGTIFSGKNGFWGEGVGISWDGSSITIEKGVSQKGAAFNSASFSVSTGSFHVLQLWADPVNAEHGFRVNSSEKFEPSYLRGNTFRNAPSFGGGVTADIGPVLILNAIPRESDRDWLENGGAFRSQSEIESRTIEETELLRF